ncbi:MAG TPA: deoxyribonuclease V [Candidatus Bathyarchaeia archaeon]|nr:deoxyribonuclease V [Candidatus Bathyarchaeia archaeon]
MLRGKFSVEKARQLQLRLSKQVIREDTLPERLNYVAGVDVAYVEDFAIGAVAVLRYATLSLVEAQIATVKTSFPYIPTLLSFREIKPARAAIKKLKIQPDVFLVDAQGIAHPRRLGFASHLGLLTDKPTVGVAKSLLYGSVDSASPEGWSPITDKGEVLGAALSRKENEQPVYVSVGHKISLNRAIEIVKHCTKSARVPEPIYTAHTLATKERDLRKRKITHP